MSGLTFFRDALRLGCGSYQELTFQPGPAMVLKGFPGDHIRYRPFTNRVSCPRQSLRCRSWKLLRSSGQPFGQCGDV